MDDETRRKEICPMCGKKYSEHALLSDVCPMPERPKSRACFEDEIGYTEQVKVFVCGVDRPKKDNNSVEDKNDN